MKRLLLGLLWATGALGLARWRHRRRLVVLTYHGVLPPGSHTDEYLSRNFVDQDVFREQMAWLARHYRCVPLAEAVERLRNGRPLPPYSAAVTFDDGFRNNLRWALPVLKEFGIPATVFVTTGHVGRGTMMLWTERVARLVTSATTPMLACNVAGVTRRLATDTGASRERASRELLALLKGLPRAERDAAIDSLEASAGSSPSPPDVERYAFLDWDAVRELAAHGVEIGSHTVSHAMLSSLDADERRREVVDSRQEIERELGRPCVLFSYPNGTLRDFGDEDRENLRRAGYSAAFSQIPGTNDHATDPFAFRRINIGRGHTGLLFAAQLTGLWSRVAALGSTARAAGGRPRAIRPVSVTGGAAR
jgi:peptidoglycan/xylan/chitin deacetylase (PgdA/CDA1 family)